MLHEAYQLKKREIESRLNEFKREKTDEEIFSEMVFCLLTPQSKARICDKAVKELEKNNFIISSDNNLIHSCISGVRFPNQKVRRIIEARSFFINNGEIRIKDRLNGRPKEVREFLVNNVKGLGYKEASHFLRNIGLGESFAILDRHIMKNLVKYGVINEMPKSLTAKKYLEIEERMNEFSKRINIPLSHLDLLFWSEEAGKIFK